jgi:dinuclear metal center YbgI/SA1388 family protein
MLRFARKNRPKRETFRQENSGGLKQRAVARQSSMAVLSDVIRYADEILRIGEIEDYPNAINGLQIENGGRLTRTGAAVDASTATLQAAAARGVDLLIVHHGLFWPGLQSVRGPFYRQLKIAFDHNIALYSAHLPLDVHPELGNNVQLASRLGLTATTPFFEHKGEPIGLRAHYSLDRDELLRRLKAELGDGVQMIAGGKEEAQHIAIITGGAGAEIYAVASEGIDTFITGEAPHWASVAAAELGVNLFLGGHYETETFGVKALAAHLHERFDLPWEFIEPEPAK